MNQIDRDVTTWFATHYPEAERLGHKAFANMLGFFWSPCHLCDYEFGGHEWRDIDGKISSTPDPKSPITGGIAICPHCTRAGKGYRHELEEPPCPTT